MFDQLNRTRFLRELDDMLLRDKDGAIADMLQVLRERGAIKQAFAEQIMDDMYQERESYRDHVEGAAAIQMGKFLRRDGVIQFKETKESPYLTKLTGTAWFVMPS